MASEALQKRLRQLRKGYQAKLHEKIEALDASLRSAIGSGSPEECAELWAVAHNLAGTAGSYGYRNLAEVVHEMEDLVAPFRQTGDLPRPVSDGLVLLIEEARRLAEA
ncbi:MAG: Hpt domain-containing protein [Myxococcota bacterium]